ncbi:MAG TPA: hypothetical protein VK675_02295 [Candidatus Paceibacterota bacterium]|nr:hypothetical protein [Candidatus Paceibacterota bacterium]
MDAIMQSQLFFFISSLGFIVLWALVAVFLFYLIRTTNTFSRIMGKIENDINSIGDTTREMVEDMKDSVIFNFLFRKKRRHRKD